ncbi:hypothetical protein SI65_02824 [Aspergillus cristatus]|uniref:Uncharacterized protein n=1 Tax=Aspergillus cristatus TaxID=573508 RepID=A0A1E3BLZ3_ASPCR|nr:hypothetical protein SI65_02824 [Aspergillus cristatus]
MQGAIELYIATNLVFVNLCRELGITPAGLFDSQVKDTFKDFQRSVVYLLREYQCKIFEIQNTGAEQVQRIRSNEYAGSFDYQDYLREFLGPMTHRVRAIMKTLYEQLKLSPASDHYITKRKVQLKAKSGHPLLLFCVDEARGLLNPRYHPPDMRFHAFRRALKTPVDHLREERAQAILRSLPRHMLLCQCLFSSCERRRQCRAFGSYALPHPLIPTRSAPAKLRYSGPSFHFKRP